MIVGMVDDRAMRFRQQAAAPAPRFSAPSNYRYGEASAPRAAKPNVVTDFLMPFTSQTMRSGEDIGAQDLLKDAALYAAGGLIGKGIGAGAKAVGRVANLAPVPREAYLKSLTGRLYHGSRAEDKFDVDPNAGSTLDNFFNANFFTTASRDLAQTPGYGAGSFHRVKMPLETAEDLRVLDLYPGAPSVRDQFPRVADDLRDLGVNDFSVQGSAQTTKDLPKLTEALSNPSRYMPFARTNTLVPDWNDWFTQRGVNAIRHQSGAATNGDITKPVYAFFSPGQMTAVPGKTFSQGVQGVQRNTRNYLQALLQKLREGNRPYESAPVRPAFDDL